MNMGESTACVLTGDFHAHQIYSMSTSEAQHAAVRNIFGILLELMDLGGIDMFLHLYNSLWLGTISKNSSACKLT